MCLELLLVGISGMKSESVGSGLEVRRRIRLVRAFRFPSTVADSTIVRVVDAMVDESKNLQGHMSRCLPV